MASSSPSSDPSTANNTPTAPLPHPEMETHAAMEANPASKQDPNMRVAAKEPPASSTDPSTSNRGGPTTPELPPMKFKSFAALLEYASANPRPGSATRDSGGRRSNGPIRITGEIPPSWVGHTSSKGKSAPIAPEKPPAKGIVASMDNGPIHREELRNAPGRQTRGGIRLIGPDGKTLTSSEINSLWEQRTSSQRLNNADDKC